MRVLVCADDFIIDKIVVSSLEEAFGRYETSITTRVLHFDWPRSPFQFNQELKEFTGSEEDDLLPVLQEFDPQVLFLHTAPVGRRSLEAAASLKAIGVTRGGPVNVNVNAATEKGIPVFFAPGRNAQAVAEFTVGLLLAHIKRIPLAHAEMRQGRWRDDLYRYDSAAEEVEGKVVGLIGLGAIGSRMVSLLKPFGVHILVYDPYVEDSLVRHLGAERVDLPELLRRADFVSLHARVTPETEKMIGAAQLAQMKPTAHLINTARGPLVDYDALAEALARGTIAGAALDTFAVEPLPPDSPLLKMENVTVTPHFAGSSKETVHRAVDMVAADLAAFMHGRDVRHCINPQVLRGSA